MYDCAVRLYVKKIGSVWGPKNKLLNPIFRSIFRRAARADKTSLILRLHTSWRTMTRATAGMGQPPPAPAQPRTADWDWNGWGEPLSRGPPGVRAPSSSSRPVSCVIGGDTARGAAFPPASRRISRQPASSGRCAVLAGVAVFWWGRSGYMYTQYSPVPTVVAGTQVGVKAG